MIRPRGANRSRTWDPGGIQLAAGAALVARACCTPGGRGRHTGGRASLDRRTPPPRQSNWSVSDPVRCGPAVDDDHRCLPCESKTVHSGRDMDQQRTYERRRVRPPPAAGQLVFRRSKRLAACRVQHVTVTRISMEFPDPPVQTADAHRWHGMAVPVRFL